MFSPEVQNELNSIKTRVLGNTATREDMKRFVLLCRQGRMAAASASASGRSGVKKPVNLDALMDELRKI